MLALAAGLITALVAGALAALRATPTGGARLAADMPVREGPQPAVVAASRAALALAPEAGPPRPSAPPPGATAAQWAALEAQMRSQPGGAAELRRVADYLHWGDAWQRWLDARAAGASPDALAADARILQAGLAERLARRELGAAEARQIHAVLVASSVEDPGERARALQAYDAELARVQPADDARRAAFSRRQADLVAAWPAAGGGRDHPGLAEALEAQRREFWSDSPSGAAKSAVPASLHPPGSVDGGPR
ncbi:MAG: hypothetical protein HYZ20_18190 [Burkholderiales bacterium]|nr:hypothetical protein [Burkholderiales bacterium]